MADEAGFLELLVANERVGRWLDILMDPYQRSRHKYAIAQLQQDLHKGAAYVEEAARQGVTQVLTKLLSQTNFLLNPVLRQYKARLLRSVLHSAAFKDPHIPVSKTLEVLDRSSQACEKTMDAISRIIAQCSGPMACGGKVSSFQYGDIRVMLQEGALGDGLGAKVWSVCHIMCRELVSHPEIYKDQVVLELGSGTGLVGLVAALAGAQQVTLTDYEDKVLNNLRTCMHMNSQAVQSKAAARLQQQQAATPSSPISAAGAQSHALEELFVGGTNADETEQQQQGHEVTDEELFDDAESVEDFDLTAMLGAAGGCANERDSCGAADPAAVTAEVARSCDAWDADNMCVRHLDWQDSADALTAAAALEADQQAASTKDEAAPCCSMVPGVPLGQHYPVILGNEVMYEVQHAQLVAAAVKHRLQPGGRALLCCAVRDQKVFDMFRNSCQHWGLRYRTVRVKPEKDEDLGGIQGRERDYEGGYLLMAVDHAGAPASDWHRDDFTEVV